MEYKETMINIEGLRDTIADNERKIEEFKDRIAYLQKQKSELETQRMFNIIDMEDIQELEEKIESIEQEINDNMNDARQERDTLNTASKELEQAMIELQSNSKDIKKDYENHSTYYELITKNPKLQDYIKDALKLKEEVEELNIQIEDSADNGIRQQKSLLKNQKENQINEIKNEFIKLADKRCYNLPENEKEEFMEFLEDRVEEIWEDGMDLTEDGKFDVESIKEQTDKLKSEFEESRAVISDYEEENNITVLPAVKEEKPKWYQFIKRFQQWRENRETKVLPEQLDFEEPSEYEQPQETKKRSFLDEIKVDVNVAADLRVEQELDQKFRAMNEAENAKLFKDIDGRE